MTVMWPSGFPKSLQFLLLVMMSLVGSTIAERSCPLGKFCRIRANCSSSSSQCVETCPTNRDRSQQGNWSTGNCERIPNGAQYWMDSTLYELFILPNVTGVFKDLLFIMSYEFQRSHDNYDYLDDITFHLYPSDNPYFYFGNGDTTHAAFQDYYDLYLPDITERCSLSSATSDPIPLDDYELQVAVSAEGTELLRRDIIIHVVNQLPSSPTHAGTYVSFSQSKYSVVEDDRQVRPVLVLSNSSSTNITVQVRSNDITATGGVDYDSGPYTVTFPAGVTSVACDIPIRDDNIMEDDETFTLTIMDGSLPDDVARGTYGQARITIVDDDKTTVSFSQSSYSVDEDDGPVQPVLVLSNPSSTDITVQVRSNDITATEGVDYDSGPYTVIFPAGVTSVSFGVPINDDNSMENDESFTLTIMGHSLPDDVTRGTPGRTRITIVDNDTIIVSFNQSTYSVDEDDGPAQPVLVLSNPSSTDITVQVRSNDITATGGVDYDSGPYTVTFPAGVTSVSFNIPIVDNNTIENDESFTLTIMDGSLPDDVTRGTPGLARITIVDDDTNSQCSFQSCPTRNVQLTEGDQPVTLPCDFNTPINSSSTATGSYTYCYNSTILVPHSSNSYTIDSIDYTLDNSKICCFNNEAQSCAVCYNFSVYYKPRNKFKFLQGPTPVFGEQYTINCEVIANPSPVCEWRRTMFQLSDVDNDDDGSSSSTGLVFPSIKIVDFPIPSEAIFTNNNCTITFNILKPNHKGDYSCTATNFLGTAHASIPTITLLVSVHLLNKFCFVSYVYVVHKSLVGMTKYGKLKKVCQILFANFFIMTEYQILNFIHPITCKSFYSPHFSLADLCGLW
ncbi:neural cell adhesion molecule 1-like [Dysidea avara]|uniref:neural cell adhesion molecule 1-like n=1 Tax=Dysidea avara TaxID=196820 RepID=UPI00331C5642